MWSELAHHLVVCVFVFHDHLWGSGEKKKKNLKIMVQENRTAHSKVNGTRTSGAGMYYDGGGVGGKYKIVALKWLMI